MILIIFNKNPGHCIVTGIFLKYPAAAVKAKLSGSVFVQFMIDSTGTIRNAYTIGTHKGYGLEEEALRVVNKMPSWKRSKTCTQQPVMYNLPIRFILPKSFKNPK